MEQIARHASAAVGNGFQKVNEDVMFLLNKYDIIFEKDPFLTTLEKINLSVTIWTRRTYVILCFKLLKRLMWLEDKLERISEPPFVHFLENDCYLLNIDGSSKPRHPNALVSRIPRDLLNCALTLGYMLHHQNYGELIRQRFALEQHSNWTYATWLCKLVSIYDWFAPPTFEQCQLVYTGSHRRRLYYYHSLKTLYQAILKNSSDPIIILKTKKRKKQSESSETSTDSSSSSE